MRIIAGTARSLPLKTVEGLDTRPTTDRIKETLFNIIQDEVPGCYFLDLFAGSGQMGLEAVSRGAQYAVFVENNKKAAACVEDNIQFTKFTKETKLYNSDVLSLTGSASSTSVSSIQANDDIQVYVEKNRMKINGKFTSATVYDLTGKIIKNISNDGTEIILNTGIYIVAIDNTVTRKIIIL